MLINDKSMLIFSLNITCSCEGYIVEGRRSLVVFLNFGSTGSTSGSGGTCLIDLLDYHYYPSQLPHNHHELHVAKMKLE